MALTAYKEHDGIPCEMHQRGNHVWNQYTLTKHIGQCCFTVLLDYNEKYKNFCRRLECIIKLKIEDL